MLSFVIFRKSRVKESLLNECGLCYWGTCTRQQRSIGYGTFLDVDGHWKAQTSDSWSTKMPGRPLKVNKHMNQTIPWRRYFLQKANMNKLQTRAQSQTYRRGVLVNRQQARRTYRRRVLENRQHARECLRAMSDVHSTAEMQATTSW